MKKIDEYLQKHVRPDDIYHHAEIIHEVLLMLSLKIGRFCEKNEDCQILDDEQTRKILQFSIILLENLEKDEYPITLDESTQIVDI